MWEGMEHATKLKAAIAVNREVEQQRSGTTEKWKPAPRARKKRELGQA
jgi:hypothetical protein